MKLSKTYEPNQYETNIYALWEASGAFEPTGVGDPYSIVMPPPNANGDLHTGHGLTVSLQDILIRYYRMKGFDTIYLPGADHAGFETWVVYEKELTKQGKNRFDFSREELYKQVWDFVKKKRGTMDLQLRALGASASWQNLTFTLDEKVVKTVYSTFKKLWDEGLIYRGERIVNYSTAYQTSYADIEVDHRNVKGTLWNIAYPIIDGVGELVVATTRPETLLGDTAVAVHPDDERYKALVGKKVMVPIIEREVPIIADEAVDKDFGTGVVKVTPAHDPNDFEIGVRHNLERIQVIGFDGKMTAATKYYEGQDVEQARKSVLAALQAAELRRGEKEIEHSVGFDYKSGLPIQPLIKDQWFIKVRPLADRAKQAVEAGEISFYPAGKGRVLKQYLDNLHDWNISRQIPWGIPIPAFVNAEDHTDWIFDDRVDQPTIEVNGKKYIREEDTFDTWFSSGQWPFITTDVASGGELSRFYPTDMMETGHDLLDRWVARMIMLGLYVTDKVPFKNVYMHGMVLDEKGQKMSKSKGNVINPMDMIDKYGSDALRLGVVANRSAGQNQAFAVDKVVAGRNFANKLWNIARFIEGKIGEQEMPPLADPQNIADHWIISELNDAIDTVEKYLAEYRFAEATDVVYHTIWGSVADWYLEASKKSDNLPLLAWVLETILKITHPFAPFVTETIWQTLGLHKTPLISQSWPEKAKYSDIAAAEFNQLKALVSETRYVTHELGGKKQILLYGEDSLIADNEELVGVLAGLAEVKKADNPQGLRLAVAGREAWLDIDQKTVKHHRKNLEKRIADIESQIKNLEGRLANESYVKNAPEAVVTETLETLVSQQALIERLQAELQII
ncbi:MAG: valine--tRNA ligase [Candidatus Saccharibacteria bacterium]|nr:valine--tRNA ligase [Candidatus Saccharibacteria bacterium]